MGMSADRRCRVAFVGAGYMGKEHAKAFAALPNVELDGVYTRTAESAARFAEEFGIACVAESVADLYARTQADLVVVSVPELAVNEVARQCFEHPWTCLIEKPAGYDLEDAHAIAAAAKSAGTKAFVALNRRHYSSTRAVLDDLRTRDDGPRLIHLQDQEDPKAALAAGQPALVTENWMYANSIHMIDFFSLFARGKVSRIRRLVEYDPAAPRFVLAHIEFDSGDTGIYEAVWNAPGPWSVAVTTPSRRWEMRPVEQAAFQDYGERRLTPVETDAWDRDFKPGLRLQAELAVRAATGQDATGLPTLDDAIATMQVTHDIYFGR